MNQTVRLRRRGESVNSLGWHGKNDGLKPPHEYRNGVRRNYIVTKPVSRRCHLSGKTVHISLVRE